MKTTAVLLATTLAQVACSTGGAAPAEPAAVRPYLDLAARLAEDRTDDLPALAAQLAAAAKADAQQPGLQKVAAAASGISSDLEGSRKAFKTVSDGMIEFMRAVPSTQTGTTIVHCTMAFSDRGALWVQREGKIANPYFGAQMLRCGDKLPWTAELPKTAEL